METFLFYPAATAHKSQGQTLERIAIDIGENAFAHGAFYVALSRVRRVDDLRLFGLPNWPEQGPQYHINQCIAADHGPEPDF